MINLNISMGTVTINIDSAIESRFRDYVYKEYGKSKGVLGKAVSQAIEKWLEERKQEKLGQEAISLMKKGFKMGAIRVKSRDELYGR